MSDLTVLENETLAAIAAASDEAALESVRVGALGKKGSISALLATLGKMSPDERKTQGAAINQLKDKVSDALNARRDMLKEAALEARLASEKVDVTLPVREAAIETGRIHPISQVMDELTAIFADMGFSIAEGPDVESDDYNFTKLIFQTAIRPVKCTTHSSSIEKRMARANCCAHIRAQCRFAQC